MKSQMTFCRWLWIFFCLPSYFSAAHAATPLTKVIMTSGSASERDGAVYVAQDQGFFKKYGLDLSFVQVRNGPVAMSALSSGETQFHWGSVSGANLGAIAEGADLVFVAGFINRLSGMFVVNAKIKTPMELKGKSIGVNSLSGGGGIFAMLMLDYWACARAGQNTVQDTGRSSGHGAGSIERHGGCGFLGVHIRQDVGEQGVSRPGRQRKTADSLSGFRSNIPARLCRVVAGGRGKRAASVAR